MKTLKIITAVALLAGAQQAYAASASGNLDVSATITAACRVDSGTMDFGSLSALALASDSDVNGTINVTCSSGTPYTIELDDGSNSAAAGTRRMTDGTNFMDYQLYTDAAGGLVWDATNTLGGTGTGATQPYTVYGRIFAGQETLPDGTYTDTVTVTIQY